MHAAAAASIAPQARGLAIPEGAELRGAAAVIRCDEPSIALLIQATAYNKRGTCAAALPESFGVKQGGQDASVDVQVLWAALRRHGGMHLVRNAYTLLQAKTLRANG